MPSCSGLISSHAWLKNFSVRAYKFILRYILFFASQRGVCDGIALQLLKSVHESWDRRREFGHQTQTAKIKQRPDSFRSRAFRFRLRDASTALSEVSAVFPSRLSQAPSLYCARRTGYTRKNPSRVQESCSGASQGGVLETAILGGAHPDLIEAAPRETVQFLPMALSLSPVDSVRPLLLIKAHMCFDRGTTDGRLPRILRLAYSLVRSRGSS